MNENYNRILSKTFTDVIESLAFMFAEPVERDALVAPALGRSLSAAMSFAGPIKGHLKMVAQEDLCKELAANMLGIEIEDHETVKKSKDALKEALNTICGRLLTAIAGKEPVFNLSTPEIEEIDPELWERIKNDEDTLCFSIDEHIVMLSLRVVPKIV